MIEKKVSLIIPFFNDEKHLERAISSAVNQTYSFIEVILVNDGSTDNSLEISEQFQLNHTNVSIISISNSGLSVARNTGVKNSDGEYIAFLDSDDELELTAIETMVNNLEESAASLCISKFYLKKKTSELISISGWKSDELIISNTEAIKKMYTHQIAYTAWGKLYRASIAKNISFEPGLWFEDRPYFLNYLLQSETVSFINKPLLSIYTSQDSITRRVISDKRILDIQKIWEVEMNVASLNFLSLNFLLLMYKNHLNSLIETIVILAIDKPQVKDFKGLLSHFNQNIKRTKTSLKKHRVPLKFKDKLKLFFLQSNQFLNWKIFVLLLEKKYSNHFENIKINRQKD